MNKKNLQAYRFPILLILGTAVIFFISFQGCKSKKGGSATGTEINSELLSGFTPADNLVLVKRTIDVAGTAFSLNYRSDRLPGSLVTQVMPIPLTGNTMPTNLKTIKLDIEVGGRHFNKEFKADSNLVHNFLWDRKDVKGNPLDGPQPAKIRIGYIYNSQDTAKWKEMNIVLSDWNAMAFGLGGWSLSCCHAYNKRIVNMGDGNVQIDIGTAIHLKGEPEHDIIVPSRQGDQIFIFDSTGRHLRTLNALTGNIVYTFKYDARGLLIAVEDAFGNSTQIERDGKGIATVIVAPYGQRTLLKQNADGYLSGISGPGGDATQFSYTKGGLLTDVTDPMGKTSHYVYDGLGRLTKIENPDGTGSALTRSKKGNQSKFVLNSTGQNSAYTVEYPYLDESQHSYIDSSGTGIVININHYRNTKTVNYPNGSVLTTNQQEDPRWEMRSPITQKTTLKTPTGLKAEITNERKVTLGDSNDPLSLKTSTESFSINGKKYSRLFDAEKKEITTTTPAGRQLVENIDGYGRVVKLQTPGMQPWSYVYDNRGRLTNITQGSDAGSRSLTIGYGNDGQIASVTDPIKHVMRFEYDNAGRITKQVLADGRQITYKYDANGNLISLTPPGRPAHNFKYTDRNLVEEYTAPADKSTHYSYDAQKRLIKLTKPDGTLAIDYDKSGLPGNLSFPGGWVHRSYDPKTWTLTGTSTADGSIVSHTNDGFLFTGADWTGQIKGSVTRTYDNNFRMSSISVNGQPINIGYDVDGLLVQSGELRLDYDPQNGLLTGSKLGNLTSLQLNNGFGEINRLTSAYDNKEIFNVQYERDAIGSITGKTEVIDGQTNTYNYTYDLAGRLIEVSKNGVKTAQYQYDDNGNRISYSGTNGNISGKYDEQDHMNKYGDATFTYTANGELATKTINGKPTNYNYDAIGNLRGLTLPDGTKIEYIVDGANRRIGKKINGTLIQGFLYQDQLQPIAELDGQNNVVSRFVYATRENIPEYMIKGEKTYRIITDHLGSPRLVVDVSDGNIVQRIDYDEYGNVIADSNPGFQPFGFAGGFYDQQSRLTRFGARDYDASTGRWTAKDPKLFAGGDANLYGYVLNDPVNGSDHFGTNGTNGTNGINEGPDLYSWKEFRSNHPVSRTVFGAAVSATAFKALMDAWALQGPPIVYGGSTPWAWTVATEAPASALWGGGGVGLGGAGTALFGVAFAFAGGMAIGTAYDQFYQWYFGSSLGADLGDLNFGGAETLADWWYHFRNGYGCGLGRWWDYQTGECHCDNFDPYWATLCPPGEICAGLPCGR